MWNMYKIKTAIEIGVAILKFAILPIGAVLCVVFGISLWKEFKKKNKVEE